MLKNFFYVNYLDDFVALYSFINATHLSELNYCFFEAVILNLFPSVSAMSLVL